MKNLFFIVSAFICLNASAYDLSKRALSNQDQAFKPHHVPKPYESYLAYEIAYAPVRELFEDLQTDVGVLKNRGEAHITVITPVEFDQVLSSRMTIEEISQIALNLKIQSATYSPFCVGSGSAIVNGKLESTYYIVVKSEDLKRIRQAVHELFVQRGGEKDAFDPNKFYSHITLGYTDNDLHESHGVIKNRRTCLENGEITLY